MAKPEILSSQTTTKTSTSCQANKFQAHTRLLATMQKNKAPVATVAHKAEKTRNSEGDLKDTFKRSRGHNSDDNCKQRRKQCRKQKKTKQKKRAADESGEARNNKFLQATTTTEPEEQEDHTWHTQVDCGSLGTSSASSPLTLSLNHGVLTDFNSSEMEDPFCFPILTVRGPQSFGDKNSDCDERHSTGAHSRRRAITTSTTLASTSTLVSEPKESNFLSGVRVPASVSRIHEASKIKVRRVHMLYNPWSGNKKGERKMRKARQLLNCAGVEVTATRLLHKGHAEVLCATTDFSHIDVLCSVGGDGTFHECINGLMKWKQKEVELHKSEEEDHDYLDQKEHIPPLAFIAAGTGNSFMHELGCKGMRETVRHIVRGINIGIDLSLVTYGEEHCYSFNSIHWGIGSRVVATAERFRWMGNSVRYIMAALAELVKGNQRRVHLLITDENDNQITWDGGLALGIANNIVTAGKGMKMAPGAKIDDGLFDLLLFTSTAKKDLLTVLCKFYNGTHINLPHVQYIKAKKFTVIPIKTEGDDQLETVLREPVDIDGELKGASPFSCEVIPQAIRVVL